MNYTILGIYTTYETYLKIITDNHFHHNKPAPTHVVKRKILTEHPKDILMSTATFTNDLAGESRIAG